MKLRDRVIRVGFWHDRRLGKLPPFTRLCYAGLFSVADREGKFQNEPEVIHGSIFPFDKDLDVGKMIAELEKAGLLSQYEIEGTKYVVIDNFEDLQPIHPKEMKSKLPSHPQCGESREVQCNPIELNGTPLNPIKLKQILPSSTSSSTSTSTSIGPLEGFEEFLATNPDYHKKILSPLSSGNHNDTDLLVWATNEYGRMRSWLEQEIAAKSGKADKKRWGSFVGRWLRNNWDQKPPPKRGRQIATNVEEII